MIRYSLNCDKGHGFDSWFKSADAFDALKASGMVTCAVCGSAAVEKSLMAPSVRTEPGERPLSDRKTPFEEAVAGLRQEVEKNSEYVGMSFASEARAMHEGAVPTRAIYGEAKVEEAKKLLEDGVPVAPLPFAPRKRSN
jgi:hypothetical protein